MDLPNEDADPYEWIKWGCETIRDEAVCAREHVGDCDWDGVVEHLRNIHDGTQAIARVIREKFVVPDAVPRSW